jgi:predicted nucleotidyltransferase
MQFNTNIIMLMSSDAKVKILHHVLNDGFRMTGRELARICGISHSMTIDTLKEFETMNLVYNFRAGKSVVWMTKADSYTYSIAKKLYSKKEDYLPIEHLKTLIINSLPGKNIKRIVLFGSVSRGKENYNSDIDLFVLVEGAKEKKIVEKCLEDLNDKCLKLYGNVLGFYLLTENELKARKKLAVIKDIEKGIKLI